MGGTALAFEVFPAALGGLPLPQLWAAAFFTMLLNVDVTSAVSLTAPLTVALQEALALRSALRAKVPLLLHAFGFLTGLVYVQRSGPHWIALADHFAPMFLTIGVGLHECLLVSRTYGARRLLRELALATGERGAARALGFWWSYALPAMLAALLVGQVVGESASPFGGFPLWFVALGLAARPRADCACAGRGPRQLAHARARGRQA